MSVARLLRAESIRERFGEGWIEEHSLFLSCEKSVSEEVRGELCETGRQPVAWTTCNTWEVPFLKVQSVDTDATCKLLFSCKIYTS